MSVAPTIPNRGRTESDRLTLALLTLTSRAASTLLRPRAVREGFG